MHQDNFFELLREIEVPKPKGIMQIGASYGQEVELFKLNGIENCILVEPLASPFEYLTNICSKTPGFVAVNALCSNVANEKIDFHVASNGGQSSSVLKPDRHLEVFKHVKFEENIQLTTTTIDIIYEYMSSQEIYTELISSIDSIYMDVQGFEYQVLLGGSKFLKKINYIYFELIRSNLYSGLTDLMTYIVYLKSQGFIINNLNFDKYHHSNVLFIRESLVQS
jgi:FkbM family methyltransferase